MNLTNLRAILHRHNGLQSTTLIRFVPRRLLYRHITTTVIDTPRPVLQVVMVVVVVVVVVIVVEAFLTEKHKSTCTKNPRDDDLDFNYRMATRALT